MRKHTFWENHLYRKPLQQFSNQSHIGQLLRERPCQLNPCPTMCYLHVLTKGQGKGTWALSQKTCQGFSQLCWQRLFGRPPFKQTHRNDKPCASTQRTPEHDQERVNQQNTVSHNSCPWFCILQLRRNIPGRRTRGAPALDHFAEACWSLKYNRSAGTTENRQAKLRPAVAGRSLWLDLSCVLSRLPQVFNAFY